MKACYYCTHSFEDEQGVWCGVDWDALEYEPISKQTSIIEACRNAREIKAEIDKQEVIA